MTRRNVRAALGFVALAAILTGPVSAFAQDEAPPRRLRAIRVNPHAPNVDGRLNDPIWQKAEFASGFMQKEPNEGEAAANASEVAVVYDDEAIYIGARLYSESPDNVLATVSRRDNAGNSERIIVSLDTYHDHRTAYTFAITASGTRIDYFHGSDHEHSRDYDWDPVWHGHAVRTADGWSAEMRIPFSQLRFNDTDVQTWGINMNRWVPTTNEDSYWIVVPKDAQGWSSRMGELVGIEGIRPSRRVELLPYVANDATVSGTVDAADPFNDEYSYNARVGGDFKMGVGPNLTLEGTVNPDFGQVEADPAEVNLSAFETFFGERRPFFTEGSNLLTGGGSGYFYSRRIGARPKGDPGGDFNDAPNNTSILGAAKLTGRLPSGTSIGVLGALTEEEEADGFNPDTGETTREGVEPRTGYGVVRVQQEFGESQSTVGAIVTGVGRDMSVGNDLDKDLNEQAYTGGADWNLRFKGGDYELSGSAGMSHIMGTPEAIEGQQRSSRRYFQRPDNDHDSVDTTRTSMTGWVARSDFNKRAGKWLWGTGFDFESPEFELNDMGRVSTTGDIDSWAGLRYRQTEPGEKLQSWWVGSWIGGGWNYDQDRQYSFLDLEGSITLKSFYGVWGGVELFPGAQSDNLTRGGPSMATPSDWNVQLNVWSNNQGRTNWRLWTRYGTDDIDGWHHHLNGGFTYRPGSRWEVSLSPQYSRSVNTRQYFDTFEGTGRPETFDNRYVFASLDRTTVVAQTRLNYAFTPDLTLELYAEPFAASGRYYDHGELLRSRENDLVLYGSDGTAIVQNEDGDYEVTDGADTFELERRDFNFVSFRSNVVLRWEWSPGSTLFLVWQQNRSDSETSDERIGLSSLGDAFTADGDNFFALKVTYWLPL